MTEAEMIKSMYEDMAQVKSELKGVKLTLENVTNKNIQIVAEGHLDLNRKLDAALQIEHDKELMLIRLNRLEDEVRQLKERITSIA